MCPLWPAHYLFLYVLVFGPLWLLSFKVLGIAAEASVSYWDVSFEPMEIKGLKEGETRSIEIRFNRSELIDKNSSFLLEFTMENDQEPFSNYPSIAKVNPSNLRLDVAELMDLEESESYPSVNVTGTFLGYGKLCVKKINTNTKSQQEQTETEKSEGMATAMTQCAPVIIFRNKGILDKIFLHSVIALVAIIYINMGAALDTSIVYDTMKRPIGPVIGFFSQFVIMPMLAYVIAKTLMTLPTLQLGLFVTGCSPAGGASNIWTLTLGGNLDLSITMTTISTFSAFAMMPLWILTVGSTFIEEAKLGIPYRSIGNFAIVLIIPLLIGIIIQRTLPKTAKFLVRALKPFAVFLILFIIVFAIYTNLYLFKLFTWEILVAGLLLPWLGYILGGGLAWLLKQNIRDIIAISIETGVQNTGLAILALGISFPEPASDITTVLPVAVALMTPVIPLAILCYQKITGNYPYQDPMKTTTTTTNTTKSVSGQCPEEIALQHRQAESNNVCV